MKELIEITENIFNRPFDILLILSGLIFMLAVVLMKLAGIGNKITDTMVIAFGTLLITAGSAMHIHLPKLLNDLPVRETLTLVSALISPDADTQTETQPLRMKIPEIPSEASQLTASLESEKNQAEKSLESVSGVCLYYIEVTQFEFVWNDRKIGTDECVSFYKPLPPAGYKIFGHYAQGDAGSPKYPVLAVKAASNIDEQGYIVGVKNFSPLLAYPLRYERIWYDPRVGAIWRPVPPLGFRCMGDVATRSFLEPDRKEIVCVKAELVTGGKNGELIWDNRSSGRLSEIAISPILPEDPEKGMILHLFQGYGDWSRRRGYASLPVMKKVNAAPAKIQAAR